MSVPTVSPKGDYGPVVLTPIVRLFEPRGRQLFETVVVEGSRPLTFEELHLPHWLVLYETDLAPSYSDSANLHAMARDRALVYVDDHLIGTLSRSHNINDVSIEKPYGQKLKILVENQGRLNFGSGLRDYKVSQLTQLCKRQKIHVLFIHSMLFVHSSSSGCDGGVFKQRSPAWPLENDRIPLGHCRPSSRRVRSICKRNAVRRPSRASRRLCHLRSTNGHLSEHRWLGQRSCFR